MKTIKTLTIEIALPFFTGFYNTIHDHDYLQEVWETEFEIDFDKYKETYAIEYFEDFMKEATIPLKAVWIELFYKKVWSPKAYNFNNDQINIDCKYNIKQIKNYLKENKKDFSEYIKKVNVDYDGFYCFITNDFETYMNNFDNLDNIYQLTQVIEFILNKTTFDYSSLYCENLLEITLECSV